MDQSRLRLKEIGNIITGAVEDDQVEIERAKMEDSFYSTILSDDTEMQSIKITVELRKTFSKQKKKPGQS